MLIAFLALLVAAAAMLALPQALKNVIDKGFTAANAAAIDRYFLLAAGGRRRCSPRSRRCACTS